MSNNENGLGGDTVENQGRITFDWERHPRGKTQIQARYEGKMFYCCSIPLNDDKAREKVIRAVVDRARDQFGFKADPDGLERGLLGIIEEMAAPPDEETAAAHVEYQVVDDEDDPDLNGMYMITSNGRVQLSNFVVVIDRDVTNNDEPLPRRFFEGRVILHGVESKFSIDSEDFGIWSKLSGAIFLSAGPKAKFLARSEIVSRAISSISDPIHRIVTENFGWTDAGDAYLTPSVRIDSKGIHPTAEDDPVHVDLTREPCASHLDLSVPEPGELEGLKRHFIDDLLPLHDRRVTDALLAAAALAVLYRFVHGMNKTALWLIGITGGGKSFLAKLFMNLFGDFPIEHGSAVASWSSTPYANQRQGFFFKDAPFVIDDYKPELAKHNDVVKIMQNYSDGSGRGRLNSDATANVTRPIRGLLIATGEAVPEQSPSSLARTVVIHVRSCEKDVERGKRCLARRRRYPALMAGFVHFLLANDRPRQFVARVEELQDFFYGPIAGQQNDLRIAANMALLGAAYEQFADFIGSEWPRWRASCRFVVTDLPALRDAMLAEVKDQQASEVFMSTLKELIMHGRVQIAGWLPDPSFESVVKNRPVIGKIVPRPGHEPIIAISTKLGLEAVQDSLRRSGMPPLAATEKLIVNQLAADGRLLDWAGRPLDPQSGGHRTRAANICGSTHKVFCIALGALTDPGSRQG